jgi:hypothetical protein
MRVQDLEGSRNFLLTTMSRPVLGHIQPPIQWVPGAISLGVKWLGHKADHSPPSSAGVKNMWSYTSTPLYAFMVWCSVKAQEQLYLLPLIITEFVPELTNYGSKYINVDGSTSPQNLSLSAYFP